jgi:hypothetical protein
MLILLPQRLAKVDSTARYQVIKPFTTSRDTIAGQPRRPIIADIMPFDSTAKF